MSEITPQQRKGRRMLVFLVVLFALPLLVVLAMYQLDYRPGGKSYGELLAPPKTLLVTATHDFRGQPFTSAEWKKKWTLVTVANSGCAESCEKNVHLLRQIHVTLNKEFDRVQRVLLVPNMRDASQLNAIQQRYPDLIVLAGPDSATLAQQFETKGQPATAANAYVVDPLGNLIMRYPEGFDPRGLQKDITRLLKYSWVG